MPALVDSMDRAIAALYRGADLSTISKGEGLGASLQGEEADMLEADDCAALAESLHEQVDRYVIRWATGDAVPLAYIWIEPTAKPDIQKEIAIDTHLAGMGARLSLRDALQRYGRAETDPKDPSDRPMTPPAAPLGGQTPLQNAADPLQNARRLPNERGGGENTDASEGVLAAFARDTSKAAAEVRKLLALVDAGKTQEAASFAASLSANLPALLPDDPEMAAVIMDAMATSFAAAWDDTAALANENPYHCPKCGKFSGFNGHCEKCGYTLDADETQKRAERLLRPVREGDVSRPIEALAYRDGLGQIDLDVGKLGIGKGMEHGNGLSKVMQKHGNELAAIPHALAHGTIYRVRPGNDPAKPFDDSQRALVDGTTSIFLESKGKGSWFITSVYTDLAKARKIERAANA